MSQSEPEWARMIQNDPEWGRMSQNDLEWARLSHNEPEWPISGWADRASVLVFEARLFTRIWSVSVYSYLKRRREQYF